jgi:hypothetical protein
VNTIENSTENPADSNIAALLRAVVQPASDRQRDTLKDLATRITSWEEAFHSAERHGILPMLYSKLHLIEKDIPADAMRPAESAFARNAFHCMANAAELLDVLREFENNGIAAMPFKGVVLAASVYGDLTARMAGDLDVLIHRRDLLRGTEILKQRGYELKTEVAEDGSPAIPDSFEYHFERPTDGMVLELRWRLELTPRFRRNLGIQWVWARRQTVKLAGGEVPSLDPVSNLLVLCMHGSKHEWSRLIWICDVAKLVLEAEPELDWDFAMREASRIGLLRSLELGVLLAHYSVAAELPPKVLRILETNRNIRKLADFLCQNVLKEPGKKPGGFLPYHIQLLDRKDRFRTFLSPAILKPNERDREFVKLPAVLEPMYCLIRPFRLLKDRTGR